MTMKVTTRISETRSKTMRAIKSRDTSPELMVRGLVYPIAPGYRLHRPEIPGKPDIAYVGLKRAIFVHGCFWHGHKCVRGARIPKTNKDYWVKKIARNRERDLRNKSRLRRLGWRSITIWECELKSEVRVKRRLLRFLV